MGIRIQLGGVVVESASRVHGVIAGGRELFLEPAHPWQRGFWIDREPGQWTRVGLGRVILCMARQS